MTKKTTRIITFCVTIFCIISFCIFFTTKHSTKLLGNENSENWTGLDTFIGVGVFDYKGNIIDNGSNLDIKNGEPLHHTIDLEQNIDNDMEYLLIAMVDFNQVPFKVEGKSYNAYPFKVGKIGRAIIDLEINIPDMGSELDYIILKNTSYIPNENNVDENIAMRNIFTSRFSLSNSANDIKYENNIISKKEGPYDYVWVSNQADKLTPIYEVDENSKLYMSLGNETTSNMDFAVVLFSNWKQINIEQSHVKYFNIKSEEKQVFEFSLPDIKEGEVLQLIAFPMPYKVDLNESNSQVSSGSLRFVGEKNN